MAVCQEVRGVIQTARVSGRGAGVAQRRASPRMCGALAPPPAKNKQHRSDTVTTHHRKLLLWQGLPLTSTVPVAGACGLWSAAGLMCLWALVQASTTPASRHGASSSPEAGSCPNALGKEPSELGAGPALQQEPRRRRGCLWLRPGPPEQGAQTCRFSCFTSQPGVRAGLPATPRLSLEQRLHFLLNI